MQTVYSEDMGSLAGDKQIFIPSGFYKGNKVAIKRINEKNIHLNREQMLELKKVHAACGIFNFLLFGISKAEK